MAKSSVCHSTICSIQSGSWTVLFGAPVVPPDSKICGTGGGKPYPRGIRSSTGSLRNSLSRLGNSRKSANVLTSVSGLKSSVLAARNQNAQPVSSPKCQAIAARR